MSDHQYHSLISCN